MDEYFEEMGGKLIKTISNGEESVLIYRFPNGEVRSSDGFFFSNVNDDSFEDALEEFECGWREIHWNKKNWSDWYDCEETQVEDAMDDDLRGF